MAQSENISGTGIEVPDVKDPIQPDPGSEDQKPIPAATDDTAEPAAETTEQQEAHKQSKFQRRLDRQKSARVAAETEARLLREQVAKLEAQQTPKQDTGEPKREQFEDYETYLRAVAKYDAAAEADKRIKSDREERQGREKQAQAAVDHDKTAKAWSERETAFQSEKKDYTETVTSFLNEDEFGSLSESARRGIVESDLGPQLLYHLAKHPEDAERIAELSPTRQIAELGKLEAKLGSPPAKKASNAPEPPNPVKGGANAAQGYRENMTDAEYKNWRKSQGARWAR